MIFVILFIGERGDEFGGSSLDDAPGVAMEYKVHVEAGKEDCYWQYVHPGATLFVSAQVLKGKKIPMNVKKFLPFFFSTPFVIFQCLTAKNHFWLINVSKLV